MDNADEGGKETYGTEGEDTIAKGKADGDQRSTAAAIEASTEAGIDLELKAEDSKVTTMGAVMAGSQTAVEEEEVMVQRLAKDTAERQQQELERLRRTRGALRPRLASTPSPPDYDSIDTLPDHVYADILNLDL